MGASVLEKPEMFYEIQDKFNEIKAKKATLQSVIDRLETKKNNLEQQEVDQKEARVILQDVAHLTQEKLRYTIANLATLAIQSIFDDSIKFEFEIVQRRNKTEIDFFINNDGSYQEPLSSNGFGLADILSTGLRISYWSLNKNRPTFILDEPTRFLSADKSDAASRMFKMLCDKLNIQIIMVTHDKNMIGYADKYFHVTQNDKISSIEEIKEN